MTDAAVRQRQRGRLTRDPAARALAAQNSHRLHALVAALGPIPKLPWGPPIQSLERVALTAYCGHQPSRDCWPGMVVVMGEAGESIAEQQHFYFWEDTGEKAGHPGASDGPLGCWLIHLASRWGPIAATAAVLPLLVAAQKAHLAADCDYSYGPCREKASIRVALRRYQNYVNEPTADNLELASKVQVGAQHRWGGDLAYFLGGLPVGPGDRLPALGGGFLAQAAEHALTQCHLPCTHAGNRCDPDGAWDLVRQAGIDWALGLE